MSTQSNEEYIKEHKLKQLMEFLLEQLVVKRPKNPEKYLITLLERRQHLLVNRPKSSPSKSPMKSPSKRQGSRLTQISLLIFHLMIPMKKTNSINDFTTLPDIRETVVIELVKFASIHAKSGECKSTKDPTAA